MTRRAAGLGGIVCAIILAALSRATWARAQGADLAGAMRTVEVPGSQAAPAVVALALAAGAAALATTLAARWVHLLTGPVLVVTGLGAAASALLFRSDPSSGARGALLAETGVLGGDMQASATLWPLAVLAPAAGLVLIGALVLLRGRTWSAAARTRSRYARATEPVPEHADPQEDPAAVWDALSRGEDPSRRR